MAGFTRWSYDQSVEAASEGDQRTVDKRLSPHLKF